MQFAFNHATWNVGLYSRLKAGWIIMLCKNERVNMDALD